MSLTLTTTSIHSWIRQALLSSAHSSSSQWCLSCFLSDNKARCRKSRCAHYGCIRACWGAITRWDMKSRRLTHTDGYVGPGTHTQLATCPSAHAFSELLYHWTGFKWVCMPPLRIDFLIIRICCLKKRDRERSGSPASVFGAWTILRSCVFDSNFERCARHVEVTKSTKIVAAAGEFLIIT